MKEATLAATFQIMFLVLTRIRENLQWDENRIKSYGNPFFVVRPCFGWLALVSGRLSVPRAVLSDSMSATFKISVRPARKSKRRRRNPRQTKRGRTEALSGFLFHLDLRTSPQISCSSLKKELKPTPFHLPFLHGSVPSN